MLGPVVAACVPPMETPKKLEPADVLLVVIDKASCVMFALVPSVRHVRSSADVIRQVTVVLDGPTPASTVAVGIVRPGALRAKVP